MHLNELANLLTLTTLIILTEFTGHETTICNPTLSLPTLLSAP